MKTLTVKEASSGLEGWVERALAGEQIQIQKGNGAVELRPKSLSSSTSNQVSPREALRRLQTGDGLNRATADKYLDELRRERSASRDS